MSSRITNGKKIFIQQPNYLPWIGYFEQIDYVDTFVFFDDVEYIKRSWQNRNRIKTPHGESMLTVPVLTSSRSGQHLKDVEIIHRNDWVRKHIKSMELSYRKARYFGDYWDGIKVLIESKYECLCDLNCALIERVSRLLGIDTRFKRSSELQVNITHRENRVIEICKKLDSHYLYNGKRIKEFMLPEYFIEAGITVELQDYRCESYNQLWNDEFVPYLSILDLLFNEGPNSLDIIRKGQEHPSEFFSKSVAANQG